MNSTKINLLAQRYQKEGKQKWDDDFLSRQRQNKNDRDRHPHQNDGMDNGLRCTPSKFRDLLHQQKPVIFEKSHGCFHRPLQSRLFRSSLEKPLNEMLFARPGIADSAYEPSKAAPFQFLFF